jgi:hypothetical protein
MVEQLVLLQCVRGTPCCTACLCVYGRGCFTLVWLALCVHRDAQGRALFCTNTQLIRSQERVAAYMFWHRVFQVP